MTEFYPLELSLNDMRALQVFAQLSSARPASTSQALQTVCEVMNQLIDDTRMGFRHVTNVRDRAVDGLVSETKPFPLPENFCRLASLSVIDPVTERLTLTYPEKRQWDDIASYMMHMQGTPKDVGLRGVVAAAIGYTAELAVNLSGDVSGQPRSLSVVPVDEKGRQKAPMMGRHVKGLNF